jgi:hypothetical protein
MRACLSTLLVLLCACGGNRTAPPSLSTAPAARVEASKTQQTQQAAAFVAGSTKALAEVKEPPKAVKVAQEMNTRAAASLPAPAADDLLAVNAIVADLLAELAETRAAGEKKLAEIDGKIVAAAKERAEAEAELARALEKERAIAATNAEKAALYDAERRRAWFARLADLLGSGGLVALAVAFPALAPLAGRAFGLLSRVMPGSAAVTGVVSRASFDGVVAGVERVRKAIRAKDGETITAELAEQLDGLLREERSREDIPLIRERRHRVARRD